MAGKTLLPFLDVVRWGVAQKLPKQAIDQTKDNLDLPYKGDYVKTATGGNVGFTPTTPDNTTLDELFDLKVDSQGSAILYNKSPITDANVTLPWFSGGYTIKTTSGFGDGNNSSTEYVFIPNCVTELEYDSFNSNPALKGVTFPPSLESIGEAAFFECVNFESPVFVPYKITSLEDEVFRETKIPSLDTGYSGSMTIGKNSFRDCTSLATVNLRLGLTSIDDNAFEGCSGLTEVTLPKTIETLGDEVFKDCDGINTISILSATPPSIGTDVFNGATSLTEIHVRNGSNFGSTFGGITVVDDL